MNEKDFIFPTIKKSLDQLIEDQEGNIPGNKLLLLGTMIVILGSFLTIDAFAAHQSHRSHSSHSSHKSGSGHGNSHYNHGSHGSHESHQSHTSHSNTGSHSNSRYSAEGDVEYSAPSAYAVPGISIQPVHSTTETFKLPEVNQNIEVPSSTPTSSIIPAFSVPATSVAPKIDADQLHVPSLTEDVT